MIWTLATMLKCPCSAFFSNYVEHINDICDTLFLCFECQRIQKKLYHEPTPWDITSKYKHKIKKTMNWTLFYGNNVKKFKKKMFVTHSGICTNQFFLL